ncbi:MAG: hypothetical protein CME06_00165, partial [Gemmatimonadetes bacterium]|nr:hypothetical protein [Gemmatimonadota bacterium]
MRLTLAALCSICSLVASGTTIHIPADQPTIQAGIDAASQGDTVLVAPGTYTGDGNRDIDFGGTDLVLISEEGAEATVIDCEGSRTDYHRGFDFHMGESAAAVIEGFTIRGGYVGGDFPSRVGGGIRCAPGSPTLLSCIITENSAISAGGIYCADGSMPVLADCTISHNTSRAYSGGGLYCALSSSSPVLTDCAIVSNYSNGHGGGIACWGSCVYPTEPVLVNCVIADNSADANGGAFYGYGYGCGTFPILINCIVANNSAFGGGGLFLSHDCSPSLTNCIIAGNSALRTGGGVDCASSSPILSNCTIAGNTAEDGGGISCYSNWMISPAEPVLTNCVLWSNTPDAVYNDPYDPGYPVFTYCDIEGGGWFGAGNIDA